MTHSRIYGVAAEFDDPAPLVDAVQRLHQRGFRRMEAYTPYPIHELDEYIEGSRKLPLIVLSGGLLGTLTAWSMQFYIAVIDYPTNIGGRPLNSWPSFIVIMFELTILFAGLSAFLGMLALCGFPLPHHPIFGVPRFEDASNNRFFLCVESQDPQFDREAVVELLSEMDPLEVRDVADD
jgi:hypothetical protein